MDATVPVAGVTNVGPDAVAIDFETPEEFEARPGQFVKLTFEVDGQDQSRFYTVSSPGVSESFEITVEIDPDGEVGPLLADLAVGDEVAISGPFGNAYYEGEQRVLVIAGGPGIGPAVGIAERVVEDGGNAAVVYRDEEPIHVDRLNGLRDAGVTVSILGDDESLKGAVESADRALDAADATTVSDTQVFVYGFADFLDDATAALSAIGADPQAAKVENFG